MSSSKRRYVNITIFNKDTKKYDVVSTPVEYVFEYKGYFIAIHRKHTSSTEENLFVATELTTGFGVSTINTILFSSSPNDAAKRARHNLDIYDVPKSIAKVIETHKGYIEFPINENLYSDMKYSEGNRVESVATVEFKNKKLNSSLDKRLNR